MACPPIKFLHFLITNVYWITLQYLNTCFGSVKPIEFFLYALFHLSKNIPRKPSTTTNIGQSNTGYKTWNRYITRVFSNVVVILHAILEMLCCVIPCELRRINYYSSQIHYNIARFMIEKKLFISTNLIHQYLTIFNYFKDAYENMYKEKIKMLQKSVNESNSSGIMANHGLE